MHTTKRSLMFAGMLLACTLVLSGCGSKKVPSANESAVTPGQGTAVEEVTGSTQEQVQTYTQQAQEALSELKAKLEQQQAEGQSALQRLFGIHVAHAQDEDALDDTLAEEIEELLDEIQLNTDLALEAAEAETDADELQELLDEIQDVQEQIVEELEDAATELSDDEDLADVVDTIGTVVEDTEASIENVDTTLSEVELALEAGQTVIDEVSFETTVDVLKDAGEPVQTGFNRAVLHQRRVERAKKKVEDTRARLIEQGLSEEEVDQAMQDIRDRIEEAAQSDNKEARKLINAQFRELAVVKKAVQDKPTEEQIQSRLAKAQEQIEAIQAAGGNVPQEVLDRLASVSAGDSLVEAAKLVKKIEHDVRTNIRQDERKARIEERREAFQDIVEAKKSELDGDLSPDQFKQRILQVATEQRANVLEFAQERRQAIEQGDVSLDRVIPKEKLQEVRVKVEARKEQVENIIEKARDKAEEVREERKARIEERVEIKNQNQEIKEETQEENGELRQETRIENRQNVQETREENKELREQATPETRVETRQEIRENQKETIQENRQNVQDTRVQTQENRQDTREQIQDNRQQVLPPQQQRPGGGNSGPRPAGGTSGPLQ